jgi:hypothetical protein
MEGKYISNFVGNPRNVMMHNITPIESFASYSKLVLNVFMTNLAMQPAQRLAPAIPGHCHGDPDSTFKDLPQCKASA